MSGVLALVGGGEWSAGCTFDAELLALSGGTEVAILPTGSAYENPGLVVDRARAWFADLGATIREVPVLTRGDAFVEEHVEAVRSASFVYLAGASPMHLRSVLKDTPLYEALAAARSGGAVVVGTGAGADVLCDPMVDTRGGAFTVGLGLVPNLAVIPRVNQWSPEKVHRTVELAPAGVVVAALPEATALVHPADGTWRAEGVGEVTVYVNGHQGTLRDIPPAI